MPCSRTIPARVTHSLDLSGRMRGLLLAGSEENAAWTAEAILSGWGSGDAAAICVCDSICGGGLILIVCRMLSYWLFFLPGW